MENDAELLHRHVNDHDENAFTELVRLRLGLVYSIALRRVGGDIQLAEDVAQKVFSDLARKGAKLSKRTSLTGWLYVSTHHASAEAVRSERRRKTRELESQTMQTLLDESAPEPDLNRLRLALDEVVVALRDDEREAIALRFFEQRSFAEIGATLRLSEEAARKRLDRALKKLRLALSRRGLTSTSLALTAALGELGASTVPANLATQITGRALSQNSVIGTGGALAALLSPSAILAGAALLFGGWAVVVQIIANQKLEGALTGFTDDSNAIATLRISNDQRMRDAIAAEGAPPDSTQAQPQTTTPSLSAAPSPVLPPSTIISVTPEGSILWGKDPVTLDEFLVRLDQMRAATPNGESTLLISSAGQFGQMAYVIDEARKAGIVHVHVNSSRPDDPTFRPGWF